MTAVLPKTYSYKFYRAGVYLGSLAQNVKTPFTYTQQINTPFATATFDVGVSAFTANQPVQTIDDESGVPLQDESGNNLTTERAPDIIGNSADNILIRTNNNVVVTEYSRSYPNGKIVFQGYITYWEANFASMNYVVTVNLMSHGCELNNYLVTTGGGTPIFENLVDDGSVYVIDSPAGATYHALEQSFAGSNATINALKLKVQSTAGATIYASIFQMTGSQPAGGLSDPQLGLYASTIVSAGASPQVVTINFSSPATLVSGNTYYVRIVTLTTGGSINVYGSAANPYASGQLWQEATTFAGVSTYTSQPTIDLYFGIYAASDTTSTFVSVEPIAMLRSIVDDYVSKGGSVNYASGSTVTTTSTVTSYSFNTNTSLEGVAKALEFCPSTWYWYADPATDILYAKQVATTATHKMIIGRHLASVKLRGTVENVINQIYFTGGPTAGVNLFKKYTGQTSISAMAGRVLMQRVSDNRVTVATAADTLGANRLALHPSEEYTTTIRVYDNTYDTQTMNLGDTVGFGNAGNFIDSLVIQITQLTRTPEYVDLTLGPLLPTMPSDIASTQRDVTQLLTVANPSAPS